MADTSFIVWVQQFSSPSLDAFFRAITFLGNEEYYVLSIPLFFWMYSKKFAIRFAVFVVLNAYLNSALKHIFRVPRPPADLRKIRAMGYSFPSGHAQGNAGFWGYLAVHSRKPVVFIAAIVLFSLVAFSRVYLGVHYPRDILVGIPVGLLALLAFEAVVRRIEVKNWGRGQWMLASLAFGALVLVLPPKGDKPIMGFVLGALWGYRLEEDFVGFKERGYWWQNIIKGCLGIAVLAAIYTVKSRLVMPLFTSPALMLADDVTAFTLYMLMGLWVTLGAPWLFRSLKLEKEDRTS